VQCEPGGSSRLRLISSMAVYCYPDKQYCAYFTEVQDIEDHCVDDAQDDESAATDGQLHPYTQHKGLALEAVTGN